MWGWLGQLGNGLKKVGTGLKDGANKITHLGGGPDGNAGAPGVEMPTPTFQRPQVPAPGSVGADFDQGASTYSPSPVNFGSAPSEVSPPHAPYQRPESTAVPLKPTWDPIGSVLPDPMTTPSPYGMRPPYANAGEEREFSRMPPPSTPTPSLISSRPPALAPGPDPSSIASPVFTRQTGPTREQTPIPQLPGHPGDPRPYDPTTAAKYNFVMSHAKHNADGSYLDPADKEHGGGFKRDWKSIGKNFALGARQSVNQTMRNNPHASTGAILGSALGGGLGGGATAAISPEMGYENEFDQMHAPQMEADQQRVFTRGQQQHQQDQQSADLEYKRTMTKKAEHDMQSEKARDRYMTLPGGGIYDTQDQYFVREPAEQQPKTVSPHWLQTKTGQWFDANNPANAELLKQGVPPANAPGRLINVSPGGVLIDPESKQPVFSNPSKGRGGGDGKSPGGAAGKKIATVDDVRAYASQKGISESEAHVAFQRKGYTVK